MKRQLEDYLYKYFGYEQFRQGQKEIIEDVLEGRDCLGVLPTGSGKSLCYQLPAMLLEGTTVVISPLISLMMDQVKELKAMNFKAVIALNSFMSPLERRAALRQLASYRLIYISPELLQYKEIQSYLKRIHIQLCVIDEAHCISQWGHEFRPDYLKLNNIISQLNNPTVLALSATITNNVLEDIITSLNKPLIKKHIYPMDRENIAFYIQHVNNDMEKMNMIEQLLYKFRVPTLIYFSSRDTTEKVAKILDKSLPESRIAFYHGGMEQMDRISVQQQFMNDQLDVICCTSAFGMGINKDDIRLVIHYHFSPQMESYIQEVGRTGRDGKSSVSVVLYKNEDERLPSILIQSELPTEDELTFTFNQLYLIAQQRKQLPKTVEEIEKTFLINEVKWRFIYYQIEKNGMILEDRLIYEEYIWKEAFKQINIYRQKRLTTKENKLAKMIEWLNEPGCLRKSLYKDFQKSYVKPEVYCCSNCGFSFINWQPEQKQIEVNHVKEDAISWDEKLQSLLLIGVHDETK